MTQPYLPHLHRRRGLTRKGPSGRVRNAPHSREAYYPCKFGIPNGGLPGHTFFTDNLNQTAGGYGEITTKVDDFGNGTGLHEAEVKGEAFDLSKVAEIEFRAERLCVDDQDGVTIGIGIDDADGSADDRTVTSGAQYFQYYQNSGVKTVLVTGPDAAGRMEVPGFPASPTMPAGYFLTGRFDGTHTKKLLEQKRDLVFRLEPPRGLVTILHGDMVMWSYQARGENVDPLKRGMAKPRIWITNELDDTPRTLRLKRFDYSVRYL